MSDEPAEVHPSEPSVAAKPCKGKSKESKKPEKRALKT